VKYVVMVDSSQVGPEHDDMLSALDAAHNVGPGAQVFGDGKLLSTIRRPHDVFRMFGRGTGKVRGIPTMVTAQPMARF